MKHDLGPLPRMGQVYPGQPVSAAALHDHPLDDPAIAALKKPARTPADVADDFAHAREVMQRSTATRRTIEAQADIAAARQPPTDMEVAMQEIDRAAEFALEEHRNPPAHYRGHGDGPPAQVVGLDAALSNAAIADTPAVREMGGLKRTTSGCKACDALGWEIDNGKAIVLRGEDAERHRAVWDALPADRVELLIGAIKDPDPVILTGPEAERYRAITAAARKAQASATAARADGAAVVQLFQAFCAGVAPGTEKQ